MQNNINFLPHLLALFTGFLGPLIMYVAVEDKKVKQHAAQALNWQLSLLIYSIISVILILILVGILLLLALLVMNFVFCIIATIKASDNKVWKYPLSIPFL